MATYTTCKMLGARMETHRSLFLVCFHRSPAVQLHLRPDRRHAVRSVVAGWPVLVGAAAAAAGHRLRGSAAQCPHPPLQSEAAQTGRTITEWNGHREEEPLICTGKDVVPPVFPCPLPSWVDVHETETQKNLCAHMRVCWWPLLSGVLYFSGATLTWKGIKTKNMSQQHLKQNVLWCQM